MSLPQYEPLAHPILYIAATPPQHTEHLPYLGVTDSNAQQLIRTVRVAVFAEGAAFTRFSRELSSQYSSFTEFKLATFVLSFACDAALLHEALLHRSHMNTTACCGGR